jgi:hypothetical protein
MTTTTTPPTNADLPAREELHQIAATLAAGLASAFQLPVSSLDPTFKDPALANLVAVQWGAHKIFYAALLAALEDNSWGSPQSPPAPVPAPVAGGGLPGLLSALTSPVTAGS